MTRRYHSPTPWLDAAVALMIAMILFFVATGTVAPAPEPARSRRPHDRVWPDTE